MNNNKILTTDIVPSIFIAEAGINHDGSLEKAIKMVDIAAEANADYVKFQTFKTEEIVTLSAPKANYQLKVTDKDETQFQMLKKLELNTKLVNNNYEFKEKPCKILYNEKST